MIDVLDAGLSEVARFLAQHQPFTSLTPEELSRLVIESEIEYHPAGSVILAEGGEAVTFLRVVHSGAVDVAHRGKLLDLLGPGDTFGHASMISGLPAGFEARAAQDTLCYRIPMTVARPLLEQVRTEELSSSAHSPSHMHVSRLIREPTLRCAPGDPIADVARRMTELGAGCAIVELADGRLGIVTDRDLRTRVLAAGRPASAPIETVMSTPVFTVRPDRIGGEVLFELLERGVRRAPIVSADGQLIGVVSDGDLFAAQARPWFGLRRAIVHAADVEALAAVSARLPRAMIELRSTELKALEVARVLSALHDALAVRSLELAAGHGPQDGVAWLALGTHARRELTPASLVRGACVLGDGPAPPWLERLTDARSACGLTRGPLPRTAPQWESRAGTDPMALSVLLDRRLLWGDSRLRLPHAGVEARRRLREQLSGEMLEYVIPTGFDDRVLLDRSGRRSEQFDIRRSIIAPIVALARWGGLVAGTTEGSTRERLALGAEHGVLTREDARDLGDAFELAYGLRIDHQLRQLADGVAPDDTLDPAALSGLTRSQLRDVFRTVTSAQRAVRA